MKGKKNLAEVINIYYYSQQQNGKTWQGSTWGIPSILQLLYCRTGWGSLDCVCNKTNKIFCTVLQLSKLSINSPNFRCRVGNCFSQKAQWVSRFTCGFEYKENWDCFDSSLGSPIENTVFVVSLYEGHRLGWLRRFGFLKVQKKIQI